MTALRVSRESAALAGPAPGDMACPYAVIERVPIKAINNNGSGLVCNLLCLSLMRALIYSTQALLGHLALVALVAQISPSRNACHEIQSSGLLTPIPGRFSTWV